MIELLAVIVILSAVMSIMSAGMSSADHAAKSMKTIAGIRDLDARGRMLARTTNAPTRLLAQVQTNTLLLHSLNGTDVLGELQIAADLKISLATADQNPAVVFDRLGRSDDYTVVISNRGHGAKFKVCGLTGWFIRSGVHDE